MQNQLKNSLESLLIFRRPQHSHKDVNHYSNATGFHNMPPYSRHLTVPRIRKTRLSFFLKYDFKYD